MRFMSLLKQLLLLQLLRLQLFGLVLVSVFLVFICIFSNLFGLIVVIISVTISNLFQPVQ